MSGFEAVDAAAGIFKITNRFYFTNPKNIRFTTMYFANGKTIKGGKVSLDIAPQASKEFTVPMKWSRKPNREQNILSTSV